MKDLRVELNIKNNLLYNAIIPKHKNILQFCEECDLNPNSVGDYINFKNTPITKYKTVNRHIEDGWYVKDSAIKLAKALNVNFMDIFPVVSLEVKQNKFVDEMDSQEFLPYDDSVYFPLLEEHNNPNKNFDKLYEVLDTLTENEHTVLLERFGFNGSPKSLAECGETKNLTRERIRQIEAKALRKLRHPSRSNNIRHLMKA